MAWLFSVMILESRHPLRPGRVGPGGHMASARLAWLRRSPPSPGRTRLGTRHVGPPLAFPSLLLALTRAQRSAAQLGPRGPEEPPAQLPRKLPPGLCCRCERLPSRGGSRRGPAVWRELSFRPSLPSPGCAHRGGGRLAAVLGEALRGPGEALLLRSGVSNEVSGRAPGPVLGAAGGPQGEEGGPSLWPSDAGREGWETGSPRP